LKAYDKINKQNNNDALRKGSSLLFVLDLFHLVPWRGSAKSRQVPSALAALHRQPPVRTHRNVNYRERRVLMSYRASETTIRTPLYIVYSLVMK